MNLKTILTAALTVAALSIAPALTASSAFAQMTTQENSGVPVFDTTPLEGLAIDVVCSTGPSWQSQHQALLDAPELAGIEFEGKFDFPDGSFIALYDIAKVEGVNTEKPYFAIAFDVQGCWIGFTAHLDAGEVESFLGYTEARVES